MNSQHERFMREALTMAQIGLEQGELPMTDKFNHPKYMIKKLVHIIIYTALLLRTTDAPSASAQCISAQSVSTQQVDKAALRALVPPPRHTLLRSLSLSVGLGCSELQGYAFFWEGRKYPAEIARITQALRQEPIGPMPSSHRALLYDELGKLYRAQGDSTEAQRNFETAVALYAQLLARKPDNGRNGRFLADYALALQHAGQPEKAAQQARTAVRFAQNTWQTWAAAGQILMRKAQAMRNADHSAATTVQARTSSASSSVFSSAQAVWNAARHDFDTAIKLAPHLPQPYELRATFRSAFAFAANPNVISSVAGVSDYEQAVALRPRDPYALAYLAWMEYTDYGVHYFPGQSYDNFAVWKVLPPAKKQALLEVRHRIESLTTSRDTLLSARAYTALAWLEYEFHDVTVRQAQTHLRQALKLQPDLSEAGQMLMHTYGIEEQWEALARFAVEQGQRHLAVRWQLIAAYANYQAKRLEQAEAQTRAAVNLAPEDLAANLFLSFLLLRSDAPEKWKEAEHWLAMADARLMTINHYAPEFKEAREESAILRGFYFILLEKQEEGRQKLRQLLEENKENVEARRALTLLLRKLDNQK